MKREKPFVVLCAVAIAVAVIDAIFLNYVLTQWLNTLNGKAAVTFTSVLKNFSLAVAVINGVLALYTAVYVFIRAGKRKK
jgi:ACR3 family arsenite efflux pump ArsB